MSTSKIKRPMRREGFAEWIAFMVALLAIGMSLVYLIGRM